MRILVAMSGGVDSSAVAGILHEAGHDVIGVTLQLNDYGVAAGRNGACCAGQDIYDARRVADHLGIPHYVVGAEKRFAERVVADFADSYAMGETPVPCMRCNQTVKFRDLTALARGLGAERLATGHYVRRIDGPGGPELHRAIDARRDQSWFLFATTLEQLAMTLFPLGEMLSKHLVRREAERLRLPVATKPDSQDLCFVASGHYSDTVARLRPEASEPGEIVSSDGRILGHHDGIGRYTVGQRKRLGAASVDRGESQRVIRLDPVRRRITVGARMHESRYVPLRELNWLSVPPRGPLRCRVKLRAQETPRPAILEAEGSEVRVVLDEPTLPAPGQACVFYVGDRVIGGGIICRSRELQLNS